MGARPPCRDRAHGSLRRVRRTTLRSRWGPRRLVGDGGGPPIAPRRADHSRPPAGECLCERIVAPGSDPGTGLEYKPDAVVVTFKVRGVGGAATCPSNPHFPVTIELTEALGERRLLDGGVTPPRDATVDPTIRRFPNEDCGPLVGTDDAKVACIAFVNATLADRYAEFARVRVAPAEADCADDTCTEASAIEARTWIVDASDLGGTDFRWTCAYRDEVATCTPS